jgi:hypothetical protein
MITIDPVTEMSRIKELMSDEDLWYRFSEGDGDYDEEYIEATEKEEWYGICYHGCLVGALKCDQITEDSVMLHPYLLPLYRFAAKELPLAVYKFLSWFRPDIGTLYSAVPDCFPEVQRYQGLCGFSEIGRAEEDYYKDHDYHGLTFYRNVNWKVRF